MREGRVGSAKLSEKEEQQAGNWQGSLFSVDRTGSSYWTGLKSDKDGERERGREVILGLPAGERNTYIHTFIYTHTCSP